MAAEVRGWRVAGRVQGVFFRASTQRKALQLGLTGCARNEADGTVNVVARGEPELLDALENWLKKGPPAARVEEVRPMSPDPRLVSDSGFETG
ncbi:MAG: acylphosphatase [Wenzhouxiangella sp.]|jgi:acylphosphatase|nr:acylphosphatase [Wenzhouxiangella sp.]